VLAKLKTPASSRKNARFSGNSSEKRERLICRVSTSVSPKSVLTVPMSLRLGVMRYDRSSPGLARSVSSPVAA
jgi:hypothetical protein